MDFVFAGFGESQLLGASKKFLILGRGCEDFLSLTISFGLSGVDLLGIWGNWNPPGVGVFVQYL